MNETIAGVIEAIRANRARFEAFCQSLTEEQLNRPVPGSTWVVRDFAAHLGTLDIALRGWFAGVEAEGSRRAADAPAFDPDTFDVDAFNDAIVAERRSWPLSRVFEEAAANRAPLIDQLAALSDAEVERILHFAGDAKRSAGDLPLKVFLAGWAQHDPIHVADMLKAIPERAADADLVAWLDNPFVRGYQAVMNH